MFMEFIFIIHLIGCHTLLLYTMHLQKMEAFFWFDFILKSVILQQRFPERGTLQEYIAGDSGNNFIFYFKLKQGKKDHSEKKTVCITRFPVIQYNAALQGKVDVVPAKIGKM